MTINFTKENTYLNFENTTGVCSFYTCAIPDTRQAGIIAESTVLLVTNVHRREPQDFSSGGAKIIGFTPYCIILQGVPELFDNLFMYCL